MYQQERASKHTSKSYSGAGHSNSQDKYPESSTNMENKENILDPDIESILNLASAAAMEALGEINRNSKSIGTSNVFADIDTETSNHELHKQNNIEKDNQSNNSRTIFGSSMENNHDKMNASCFMTGSESASDAVESKEYSMNSPTGNLDKPCFTETRYVLVDEETCPDGDQEGATSARDRASEEGEDVEDEDRDEEDELFVHLPKGGLCDHGEGLHAFAYPDADDSDMNVGSSDDGQEDEADDEDPIEWIAQVKHERSSTAKTDQTPAESEKDDERRSHTSNKMNAFQRSSARDADAAEQPHMSLSTNTDNSNDPPLSLGSDKLTSPAIRVGVTLLSSGEEDNSDDSIEEGRGQESGFLRATSIKTNEKNPRAMNANHNTAPTTSDINNSNHNTVFSNQEIPSGIASALNSVTRLRADAREHRDMECFSDTLLCSYQSQQNSLEEANQIQSEVNFWIQESKR